MFDRLSPDTDLSRFHHKQPVCTPNVIYSKYVACKLFLYVLLLPTGCKLNRGVCVCVFGAYASHHIFRGCPRGAPTNACTLVIFATFGACSKLIPPEFPVCPSVRQCFVYVCLSFYLPALWSQPTGALFNCFLLPRRNPAEGSSKVREKGRRWSPCAGQCFSERL